MIHAAASPAANPAAMFRYREKPTVTATTDHSPVPLTDLVNYAISTPTMLILAPTIAMGKDLKMVAM